MTTITQIKKTLDTALHNEGIDRMQYQEAVTHLQIIETVMISHLKSLAHFRTALETIADIPLWGEVITDRKLRGELIELSEYDIEENLYSPSSESECLNLEKAVETARLILGLPTRRIAE